MAGVTKNTCVQSCIKMKLGQFCRNEGLRRLLDKTVMDCNIAMAEAYAFANLHVTRMMELGKPIDDVGAKFYDQCINAVTKNKARESKVSQDMKDSKELFDSLRPKIEKIDKVDFTLLGDIKSELCISMSTMADNHLWMNFASRLKKYLSWTKYNLSDKLREAIVLSVAVLPNMPLSKVSGFAIAKDATEARKLAVQDAKEVALELRKLCPLKTTNVSSKTHTLLPLFFKIMKETETAFQQVSSGVIQDPRLKKRITNARFSLLPNKSGFTLSHIPICDRALIGLLRRVKDKNELPLTKETKNQHLPRHIYNQAWRRWFNVTGVETHTRYFGNRISTDGVAVTIYFEHMQACVLSNKSSDTDLTVFKEKRGSQNVIFAGIDPGISDVVTVAHTEDPDAIKQDRKDIDVSKVSPYSGSRYYEDAKVKIASRRTTKWNQETKDAVGRLDHMADRSSVAGLSQFMITYLGELRDLLSHRAQRGYRNMRFMRYVFKQKAVQSICDLIAPKDKHTFVGFEDWNGPNGTPIKRRFCGPLQDIKRELKRRDNVTFRSIWKFRTSVMCHVTWRKLSNMKAESTVYDRTTHQMVTRKRGSIHKVLHCRSSKDATGVHGGGTWNRDTNASRNILMLLMRELNGLPRPTEFMPETTRLQPRRLPKSGERGNSSSQGTVIRAAPLDKK